MSPPHPVPQLSYFNVTALGNQSLLVAWQLEYDGGQPITSMNITVEALDSSSPAPVRAAGRATPVTYSVGVNDSYLLTSSFPQGWSYLITADVQNKVGTNTFKATGKMLRVELKKVFEYTFMIVKILRLWLHVYLLYVQPLWDQSTLLSAPLRLRAALGPC